MVMASHCVGFTLPGMILELTITLCHLYRGLPRFVFGDGDFAETAAGTAGEVSDVVGDFHETACEGVQYARSFYDGVMGCEGLKFVWCSLKLFACEFGYFLCDFNIKANPCIDSLKSIAV